MLKDVESYKKLLKDMKSTSGTDLYTHLVEVFGHLMRHYPEDALDKIEEVSYLCKNKDSIKIEEFLKLHEETRFKTASEALQSHAEKAGKLFEKPKLEEDEEEPEKAAVGNVPDLIRLGKMFEWAGVSFTERENFLLQKSIAKLAEKSTASKIRFWGKIYGTEHDYLVAEGVLDGGEEEGEGEEEKPADFEIRGTGVNQFVYWVTHDTLSQWVQLPDLMPKYLKTSRHIKISFTGNLERELVTNPFFGGKEKHYLRAQLARIHHGTSLIPRGLFRTQEEDDKEIEADEPEDEDNKYVPQTENQMSLANWAHYPKSILKNCRTGHMEPEPAEDEEIEPEELLKMIEAKDPYEPRLKLVTKDQEVEAGIPAWNLRSYGDKHRQPTLKGKTVHHGVVVIKSNRWPGSITAWKGDKWHQVYVGDGHKYESTSYFPVSPPDVPTDPEDQEECPEPNPLEAPKQPEPEGEGEGNKEGEQDDDANEE
jgi:hypothetical protein